MFFTLLVMVVAADAAPDPTIEFFKPKGELLTFKIEVDKENLAQLKKDPRHSVHCTMKVGGETFNDVGIHLKGQAGSYQDWNAKPALTLNMDKYKSHQKFKGMDKFHLNNSNQDDCYMNELITGEMFRNNGVPFARATHAMVELNGRKVGLYLLKEGFDKEFLKHYFKDTSGNLYDGGFLADIDQKLELKSGMDVDRKDLKDLYKTTRIEDKAKRLEAMEKALDVEKLYALWVLEIMCADWDGYARNRNNYKIYFDPTSKKAVMFAHGKDQMFQNANDGLIHGWGGVLCRRLYETEGGKQRYLDTMKKIFEREFDLEKINKMVDECAVRIKDKLNAENKGQGDEWIKRMKDYKNRIKARAEYIKKELPKLKP
ncbi:hypothetical protein BH11PLA2_BH11PLA2_35310 [soil metagenome]